MPDDADYPDTVVYRHIAIFDRKIFDANNEVGVYFVILTLPIQHIKNMKHTRRLLIVFALFAAFFSLNAPAWSENALPDAHFSVVQKTQKLNFFQKIALKTLQRRLKKMMAEMPRMEPDSLGPCAKIELKNGEILEVELAEMDQRKVTYRPCSSKKSSLMTLKMSEVRAVIGRNGDVIWGEPKRVLPKEEEKALAKLPKDSTGRCGSIVLKSGEAMLVELATIDDRSVSYRPCGQPTADLINTPLSTVSSISARNGDVLFNKNVRPVPRQSQYGPLIIVLVGALMGFWGVFIILYGIHLAVKRLKRMKAENIKGKEGPFAAAIVIGVMVLVLYALLFFPLILG